MKRFIASLICVLVIAGLVLTPVSAQPNTPPLEEFVPKQPSGKNNKGLVPTQEFAERIEPYQATDRFIVRIATPSLAAYEGVSLVWRKRQLVKTEKSSLALLLP